MRSKNCTEKISQKKVVQKKWTFKDGVRDQNGANGPKFSKNPKKIEKKSKSGSVAPLADFENFLKSHIGIEFFFAKLVDLAHLWCEEN